MSRKILRLRSSEVKRFLKTEEQKNKIYYFLNLCSYVKKNLEVKKSIRMVVVLCTLSAVL